ncbi:AAA family ATPase [Lactobacillus panisapium]|uniref:AAA family ATPase n=1 Tax=Lactobacillus panisapium TaxID=2012495 RepID=A0ABX8W314_9LACO|nr:AAA family ATPase [Lactobacillus panisapium]QYN51924.1 AAA family ATPase [Lactobacillus panisapium]
MDMKQYLTRCIDMALDAGSNETSYNNSFEIEVKPNGFIFVPRFPAGFILNESLYQRIYEIAAAAVYPEYTVLKQSSIYFVPLGNHIFSVERGLFYPWFKGTPTRLNIDDLDNFFNSRKDYREKMLIPLMKDYYVDYEKVTSIAIAGSTGSGKSMLLTYFLSALRQISQIVIIDPKFDMPARWARDHTEKAITPSSNSSKSDFVSAVNDALESALTTIYQRQQALFQNVNERFRPLSIVIDELAALTIGVNRNVKDAFLSLLSQISLLGRATSVHLILVSQRFDHTVVPTAIRDQMNVLIELGHITTKNVQFLFPDLDPSGIVIPQGPGVGIIQIIDDQHFDNVLPFLAPTY